MSASVVKDSTEFCWPYFYLNLIWRICDSRILSYHTVIMCMQTLICTVLKHLLIDWLHWMFNVLCRFQHVFNYITCFLGKLPVLLVHLSWHQTVSCNVYPATLSVTRAAITTIFKECVWHDRGSNPDLPHPKMTLYHHFTEAVKLCWVCMSINICTALKYITLNFRWWSLNCQIIIGSVHVTWKQTSKRWRHAKIYISSFNLF